MTTESVNLIRELMQQVEAAAEKVYNTGHTHRDAISAYNTTVDMMTQALAAAARGLTLVSGLRESDHG